MTLQWDISHQPSQFRESPFSSNVTSSHLSVVSSATSNTVSPEMQGPFCRRPPCSIGSASVLSARAIDTLDAIQTEYASATQSLSSIFSRQQVLPPTPAFSLKVAQSIWEELGRPAALDAVFDYLDDLVIASRTETLVRWLAQTTVYEVQEELLIVVLVALKPVRGRLTNYDDFVGRVRYELTARVGSERAANLLEGLE